MILALNLWLETSHHGHTKMMSTRLITSNAASTGDRGHSSAAAASDMSSVRHTCASVEARWMYRRAYGHSRYTSNENRTCNSKGKWP